MDATAITALIAEEMDSRFAALERTVGESVTTLLNEPMDRIMNRIVAQTTTAAENPLGSSGRVGLASHSCEEDVAEAPVDTDDDQNSETTEQRHIPPHPITISSSDEEEDNGGDDINITRSTAAAAAYPPAIQPAMNNAGEPSSV